MGTLSKMPFNRTSRTIFILLCSITICVFLQGQTPPAHLRNMLEYFLDLYKSNQSLCACYKCLLEGNDTWFMERFSKSPMPFLRTYNNLSANTFKWWTRLQFDRSSMDTYSTAVEEMFHFFPDNDMFMDSSPERCRTCAVVGNSGNLKGSYYGPLIDAHDVVIRMNGARTKGYKVDVGTRTTLHIMYPESAVHLENNTHLLLFPYKTIDFKWLVSAFTTGTINETYRSRYAIRRPTVTKIKANKDLVMVLNPAFMKYVYDVWLRRQGKYPSTGFLALMVSLHICDEVNVFGFGADRNGNWDHYWEELKSKKLKTGQHGGTAEYKLINLLSAKEKLHFFRGQCCSS